jgi:hypothetical protein
VSMKNCCSPKDNDSCVNVNVIVDVPKIVKYCCISGVLIVGIIFGSKCCHVLHKKCCFKLEDK